MRRTLRATAVAVAFIAIAATTTTVASAAPPAAAPHRAAVTAGTYVALSAQPRVVDTRTGVHGNGKGAVAAGRGITPVISGVGGVPTAGVGAVVITLTAVTPTANGSLVAFPYATALPGVRTLTFMKGQRARTVTAVVPVRLGRISIHNSGSSGSVHVAVDVSGYYRSGTTSTTEPGVYRAVTPRRSIDTHAGVGGVKKARVAAGKSLAISLGGRNGLPDAPGAVAATVTVATPTRAGYLSGGRADEPVTGYSYANFAAGQTVSAFVPLRVADGEAVLVNHSAGTIDVYVDVVGYWNLGFAEQPNTFQTRVQTRLPIVSIPARTSKNFTLGGRGGVERAGVAAALVSLQAVRPAASGALAPYRPGTGLGTGAALQFDAGRTETGVVAVPTSGNGTFVLRNQSTKAVSVVVDIDGYVPGNGYTQPTGKATARYLDALTGDESGDNATVMAWGINDADAGYTFTLLDVGAQSVSAPLSKAAPGVSLARKSESERVTYPYARLVELVKLYINAYRSVSDRTATVAVGTNNDGRDTWDPKKPTTYYEPNKRGADWAASVVTQLQGLGNIAVRGANDIEAGFVSTQDQALEWEKGYLSAASSLGSSLPKLYFNGSADGCPKSWNSATCAYGWTADDMVQLASQTGVAAIPQIYLGYHATQWAELAAYAAGKRKTLTFAGILTEFVLDPNTLSTRQAASALNRALLSVGRPPVNTYVVDFQQS